jgi:hypothetical protein
LDVLHIVRRLWEVGTPRCGVHSHLGVMTLPKNERTSQRDVPPNTFTTADACAFAP